MVHRTHMHSSTAQGREVVVTDDGPQPSMNQLATVVRRDARTHVGTHPIRRHLGNNGRRGALGLPPPARRNFGTNRAEQGSMEREKPTAWEKLRVEEKK